MIVANDIDSDKLKSFRQTYNNVVIVVKCTSKLNNKVNNDLFEILKGLKVIFLGDSHTNGFISTICYRCLGTTMDGKGIEYIGKFDGINRRFKDKKQLEIANNLLTNHVIHVRKTTMQHHRKELITHYLCISIQQVDKQYVIGHYKLTYPRILADSHVRLLSVFCMTTCGPQTFPDASCQAN